MIRDETAEQIARLQAALDSLREEFPDLRSVVNVSGPTKKRLLG